MKRRMRLIGWLTIGLLIIAACAPAATPTAELTAIPVTPTIAATPTEATTPTATPVPGFFDVYAGSPIVSHGPDGAWDDRYTDPGAVIFYNGMFHMFRNGFRNWPAEVQIGYVTSPDGLTWTEQGDTPVLYTKDVPYAKVAALASSVLVEADGTWVLYFYTKDDLNSPAGVIGRATASQPTGPWQVDAQPVLRPGSPGSWDDAQTRAPHVVKTDVGYFMYYGGIDQRGREMIGLATSRDGITWTKYDDPATTAAPFAESDPVLSVGGLRDWDAGLVFQPSVNRTPEGWLMIYKGTNAIGSVDFGLAIATSQDGIHWTRFKQNPVLKASVIPSAVNFWFTNSVYQNDTLYLFWEIERAGHTDIFVATHTGPIGQ
jgi:hypothetical protein